MLNLDSVSKLLEEEIPNLQGIYLFGTYAKGIARADSDVDLAILAAGILAPLKVWNLAAECAVLLKKDVDLIDLRQATTVFQHQILTQGQRIRTFNQTACELFEAVTINQYLDFQQAREPLVKQFISNMKEKGRFHD